MKIEILAGNEKNAKQLMVVERQSGQPAVKHTVQAGQRITLVVDGIPQTGAQTISRRKIKLVKVDSSLFVETEVGGEKIVELDNFYASQDAVLAGAEWTFAESAELQQLAAGVGSVAGLNVNAVGSVGVVGAASEILLGSIAAGGFAVAASRRGGRSYSASGSTLGVTVDTSVPGTPGTAPTGPATTNDTTPSIQVGAGLTDTPVLYVDGVVVPSTYDPVTGIF